jgi:hypothetical protein
LMSSAAIRATLGSAKRRNPVAVRSGLTGLKTLRRGKCYSMWR